MNLPMSSSPARPGDVRLSLRLLSLYRLQVRRWRRIVSAHGQEHHGPIVESTVARVGLTAALGCYVFLFTAWSLSKHHDYATFGFDLGIFDQGVWLLSRFKDPFVTVRGLDLFGDHTSFILVLLAPLYWVFSSSSTLLVAQTIALGAGGLIVWLLARDQLRHEILASLLTVAYLVNPALGFTNLENFHPDSFEIPLALAVLFYMIRRRWLGYTISLVALLLVKEDVALMTFALGIYIAIRYDRKIGILTSAGSLAWLGVVLFVIFPALNGTGTLYASRVAGDFGGVGGLVRATVTHPWDVIAVAFSGAKPWYLWQMSAPLAGMFLLAPGMTLVALLPLLSNLLSAFPYQHQIEFHYGTLIIPVWVTATIVGIARFKAARLRLGAVLVVTAASLVTALLWGPLGSPPALVATPSARSEAIGEAIEMVPADAAVSAAYFAVPHLSHREHIYEFPVPWRAQNWGNHNQEGQRLPQADLIDYVLLPDAISPDLEEVVATVEEEGFYPVYRSEGIVLLRRGSR